MLRRIIIIPICLGLTTCLPKKDDPTPTQLPAITQSGANTFGCMVNGELMVAVNKCEGTCPPNPRYDPSIGFLVAGKMDSSPNFPNFRIVMQLDAVQKEGIWILDTIKNDYHTSTVRCGLIASKYFGRQFSVSSDSGTFYRGQLHISKWVKGQSGFVAGTFWFDLYNPASYSDTVRVRDGRFDIPFN